MPRCWIIAAEKTAIRRPSAALRAPCSMRDRERVFREDSPVSLVGSHQKMKQPLERAPCGPALNLQSRRCSGPSHGESSCMGQRQLSRLLEHRMEKTRGGNVYHKGNLRYIPGREARPRPVVTFGAMLKELQGGEAIKRNCERLAIKPYFFGRCINRSRNDEVRTSPVHLEPPAKFRFILGAVRDSIRD